MPRILVADDNSNIQKMVALALKDEGFEVISVGNGEAAVRKLPEVSPDLVLADIFMPVRSGYEVCDYIKRDPRYAHTPVVLLVGAFDPLDENEAQRVQADGVLKKPFVPPDPLINMVKALVAKSASERLVPVTAQVTASAEANAGDSAEMETAVEEFSDALPEEFPPPAPSLDLLQDQERPLAFGSLLETPVEDVQTPALEPNPSTAENGDDSVLTAMRDPSLGEPVFWNPPAITEEQPTAEEVTEGHAWNEVAPPPRLDDSASMEPIEPAAEPQDAAEVPSADAAEEHVAQTAPFAGPISWLEPQPPQAADAAESAPVEPAPASDFSNAWDLPVENPMDVPPEPAPASDQAPVPEQPSSHESMSPASLPPEPLQLSEPAPAAAEPESDSWEAESEPVASDSDLEWAPELTSPANESVTDVSEQFAAPQAPSEDSQEAASAVSPAESTSAETLAEPSGPVFEPEPVAAAHTSSLPLPDASSTEAETAAEGDAPPNPELVDAVVVRVMDRIRPQIIEIVTREILRPVVEALVRRELDKK